MSAIRQGAGGDEDHEASLFAMSLATWAVPSYVLKAIIELDVLEIIKKAGPEAQLSSVEITDQLPTTTTNPDAAAVLDRMLRLLASLSVLTFSIRSTPDGQTERVYGLAPVCKYLTKNEDGVSLAPFSLLAHDKVASNVWNNLKDAVLLDGVPFKRTYGIGMFEYLGTDPRFSDTFFNAMNNHTAIVLKKVLETYNGFEGLTSLVDVGGATGATLKMIVSKYPTIKGINFDMPHVIENAPSYPGVEHVGGDMYTSIPEADAIFMKWTLHLGSDEECLRLLKNCHAALADHGKVIVCEYVAPDAPEASHSSTMAFTLDNIMMSMAGGKERTKEEYEALGKQAGFLGFQLVCCVCDSWVMEFLKN